MIVLLDNGHGQNTAGKCSPKWADGTQLFEYEFNRDIVKRIASLLTAKNIRCKVLVPESVDISLGERCRRANRLYDLEDGKAFLVSVHANAGGGTGWEAWTSIGKTKSDVLSTILYDKASEYFKGWAIRRDWSDGDPDKESEFYILKHTKCPAVLTENFFMDTEKDCKYIMSEDGRNAIAQMHVDAIVEFLKSKTL